MLRKGDVVENYRVLRRIGKGGFGTVFLAETVTPPKQQFALKVLEGLKINDEFRIGLEFGKKCPYLVHFKEVLSTEIDSIECLVIAQEYCDGGDLRKRIEEGRRPSDAEIYRFVGESSLAVKALHDANIVHRDINPGNFFLLYSGGTKLGDYGLARTLEAAPTKSWTRAGVEGYVPPEILEGKPYSKKADIFSLGVTYMEYILGENPFRTAGQALNVVAFLKGTLSNAARTHPHPAMDLARRMVSVNPDARPSIAEVANFLLPLSAVLSLIQRTDSEINELIHRLRILTS